MQVFIAIGVILFIGLFFLMSLPLRDEWQQMEHDIKPTTQSKR